MKIETEEDYQKAIPPWCYYQTVEEHKEHLLLCWGLLAGLKWKRRMGNKLIEVEGEDCCRGCEFYRPQRKDGH